MIIPILSLLNHTKTMDFLPQVIQVLPWHCVPSSERSAVPSPASPMARPVSVSGPGQRHPKNHQGTFGTLGWFMGWLMGWFMDGVWLGFWMLLAEFSGGFGGFHVFRMPL